MAKGNLLLGTAARSIGDVVMYRREGAQVSRIRIRQIKNPKTNAQCEQRAFMNAVVKFYQPLADVLERSFEGLSRAKSYAKFLKVNVSMARANGYALGKDLEGFQYPFQLSEGSLGSFNTIGNHTDFVQLQLAKPADVSSNPTTIGELSKFFVAAGWKEGDVVTFILAHSNLSNFHPSTAEQFIIDTTSDTSIENAIHGSVGAGTVIAQGKIGIEFSSGSTGDAVIISRNVDGVWKRTTSFMQPYAAYLTYMTAPEQFAAMVSSFGNNAGDVNPLVYLDGDEL